MCLSSIIQVGIRRVLRHPQFQQDPLAVFDIAIVQLRTSLRFSDQIRWFLFRFNKFHDVKWQTEGKTRFARSTGRFAFGVLALKEQKTNWWWRGGEELKQRRGQMFSRYDGDDDSCAPLESTSRLKRLTIFFEPRQYSSAMCWTWSHIAWTIPITRCWTWRRCQQDNAKLSTSRLECTC